MKQEKEDWASKRVYEALQGHPVANYIASTIKERLAGTMCERALRPVELTELAKILIDTVTAPPGEEADR